MSVYRALSEESAPTTVRWSVGGLSLDWDLFEFIKKLHFVLNEILVVLLKINEKKFFEK